MPTKLAKASEPGPIDGKIDRRRTNTRERIVEASTRLFYEQGFPTTTIRQIVEACDITPGAFYNHFRTKEELLYTIVKEAHDQVEADLTEGANLHPTDPTLALREIMRRHVIFHTTDRLKALVSNSEHGHLADGKVEEIRIARRRVRAIFERIILDGLASGSFTPFPSESKGSPRLAAIIVGEMGLKAADWYREDQEYDAEALAEIYADAALRVVGAVPKEH